MCATDGAGAPGTGTVTKTDELNDQCDGSNQALAPNPPIVDFLWYFT